MTQQIAIPSNALVVLIGAAGSGKSTFARRWFPLDAILSSDELRASTAPTGKKRRLDVFEAMLNAVEPRLARGGLTVLDATNTEWMRRGQLIRLARRYGRPAVAIVFDVPLQDCLAANQKRSERVPPSVVRRQVEQIGRDLDRLDLEGFSSIYRLRPEHLAAEAPGLPVVTLGH